MRQIRKVIVCGTRTFDNYDLLERTLDDLFGNDIIEIVSGCAEGADKLGEQYAKEYGLKVKKFPANWKQFGKEAGPIRNAEMAWYADECVAFWDGQSRGTKNMINVAKAKPITTHVINYQS